MRLSPGFVAAMVLFMVTPALSQEKKSPEPTKPRETRSSQELSPYLPAPGDRRETVQLDRACRNIENSYECAQAVEKMQLPRYLQQVSRKGKILRLTLKTGKVVELKDVPTDPKKPDEPVDKIVYYSFREYLRDLGYFLVEVQFWEGGEYLMVNDQNGQIYHLPDLFLLSPDRQRLATLLMSEAFVPTSIQIWRITPEQMTREWSLKPEDWGPKEGAWQDNNTLTFTKTSYDLTQRKKMMVRRDATGWKLLPAKP
jgi:hypothetical protein